jgi:hypothetical protein
MGVTMIKRVVLLIVCLFAILLLFGCATVIHGTTQKVSIITVPPGATFTVDTSLTTYSTPTTIKLRRKFDHEILIARENYEPEQVHIYHVFSMAIAGNLILGGISGWVTDSINGAKSKLIPKSINLTLKPLGTGPGLPQGQSADDRIKQLDVLLAQKMITQSEYTSLKKGLLKSQRKKEPQKTSRK